MEWNPIGGVLPPLNDGEWQRLFALYQQTSQYKLLNHGFGIRGVQAPILVEVDSPLLGAAHRRGCSSVRSPSLAARARIDRWVRFPAAAFFALGGLRASSACSWSLPDSWKAASRSPAYRLVVHLVMALILYSAILWDRASPRSAAESRRTGEFRAFAGWHRFCRVSFSITIVAGDFVAGLKLDTASNTFPIDGRQTSFPDGYAAMDPFPRNITEKTGWPCSSITGCCDAHRVMVVTTVILGWRLGPSPAAQGALVALVSS